MKKYEKSVELKTETKTSIFKIKHNMIQGFVCSNRSEIFLRSNLCQNKRKFIQNKNNDNS